MAKERRPFNPAALEPFARPAISATVGVGMLAWRYTAFVPIEETSSGEAPHTVATDEDRETLEQILTAHFTGLTVMPEVVGYGLRQGQMELNKHVPFVVYTAATAPTDHYFHALRKELEEALVQETILVERQEVWLH